jgi:hypothetical protein
VGYWSEVLPSLEARGRGELAALVREKLVDARRQAAWHAHTGWKGRLRKWDRQFLDGRMLEISRRLRSRAGADETQA